MSRISLKGDDYKSSAAAILHQWVFDYSNPKNYITDNDIQIRNNCDKILGMFAKTIMSQIKEMTDEIPEPTREIPFPDNPNKDEIAQMRKALKKIESIRTKLINASIPPIEKHYKSDSKYLDSLVQVKSVDVDLFMQLSELDVDKLDEIEELLNKRDSILSIYRISI
jgi:hypothetical protein